MANIPQTSTTLLRNIAQDPQHKRWNEFVARYRPMMEAFMRERFPSVEADDVIQETLIALCKVLPSYHYAPDEKGHFRNYITGILHNKAHQALRKMLRQTQLKQDAGDAIRIERESSQQRCGDALDEQSWRKSLFETALDQFLNDPSVADRTKRIFTRTAINGESPESVAVSLMMTRHAVDQAKSRAMARLQQCVQIMHRWLKKHTLSRGLFLEIGD